MAARYIPLEEDVSKYVALNPYLFVAKELSDVLLRYRESLTSDDGVRAIMDVTSRNRRILDIFEKLQISEKEGFSLPYNHDLDTERINFGLSDNAYQILDLGLRILRSEDPRRVLTDQRYAPRFKI
ncbi:MAG: hypothetical protein HYW22_00885 [Candidatus Aenigmarchaeota archaeon]|nr:hypothetical protein [Candidatus Aenigmarchaeota archaeon]